MVACVLTTTDEPNDVRFFRPRCEEKQQNSPTAKTHLKERVPVTEFTHSEQYRATVTRKVVVVVLVLVLVVLVVLWYRGDSGDRPFHRSSSNARAGSGAERRRKNNEKKWKRKEKMSRRNPGHSHRCPPQEEARSPQLTSRRSYGRLLCILHSRSSLSFSF